MKWKDLKKFVEENGVTDDHELNYIDVGPMTTGLELHLEPENQFRLIGSYGGPDYVQDDRGGDR